jgi:hypothetical protein
MVISPHSNRIIVAAARVVRRGHVDPAEEIWLVTRHILVAVDGGGSPRCIAFGGILQTRQHLDVPADATMALTFVAARGEAMAIYISRHLAVWQKF